MDHTSRCLAVAWHRDGRSGETRSKSRTCSLIPASFFEKKQAIDNATKVANFGPLYWAHLRLGRLNGRNFIASRADFGGNPFTWCRRVASSPLDRHAAWPIGTLLPAAPQLTNWSFT